MVSAVSAGTSRRKRNMMKQEIEDVNPLATYYISAPYDKQPLETTTTAITSTMTSLFCGL